MTEIDSNLWQLSDHYFAHNIINYNESILFNKDIIDRIVNIDSIKLYRYILDSFAGHPQTFVIETKRKKYYEERLKSMKNHILDLYYPLYEFLLANLDKINYKFIRNHVDKKANDFDFWDIHISFLLNKQPTKEFITKFFQYVSYQYVDRLIIDYHFEEQEMNFIYDLETFLSYYQDSGLLLPTKTIQKYKRIASLDSLPFRQKIELHEELKESPAKEDFYDHYYQARQDSNERILSAAVTKENISKIVKPVNYKGVKVYKFEGQPFYARIKSFYVKRKKILPEDLFTSPRDIISSFSLIGSDNITAFLNPHKEYAIAYEGFNPDQFAYVCSFDCYSNNIIDPTAHKISEFVYELLSPQELVTKDLDCCEIVYRQQSFLEDEDDELSSHLIDAKGFAIVCYDRITLNDVISAKKHNLDIILINSRCYSIKESPNPSKKLVYQQTTYGSKPISEEKINTFRF